LCLIIEVSNDLVRVGPFFCFFFWANKKRKIEIKNLQLHLLPYEISFIEQ